MSLLGVMLNITIRVFLNKTWGVERLIFGLSVLFSFFSLHLHFLLNLHPAAFWTSFFCLSGEDDAGAGSEFLKRCDAVQEAIKRGSFGHVQVIHLHFPFGGDVG